MSTCEMKRSSYYVLFLGAKESKGLRGEHYIEPVLQYLVAQEHRMQALKVTLQVSNKGLRIIPSSLKTTSTETEKHFIPYSAITCVFQAPPPNDDIVSTILMIYNPDTNCPVHVHCYRCDSSETASVLKSQLETLVNREDNQRKFRDIESRLQSKGLLSCPSPTRRPTPDFDCLTSDSSENSDRGFGSGSGTSNLTSDRVASLYDSLAAELRAKLNVGRKRNTPLLLPPRDYDTIHRQRGNLSGIESRRCLNPAVVGPNGSGEGQRTRRSYASREQESCGRSSGIGSAEDNGSPIHDPLLDSQPLQSSSDDEDWNQTQVVATESSQFLVRPTWPMTKSSTPSSPPVHAQPTSLPLPPPLPKRPELRQRSPDVAAPPPLPVFSREKFEGVRQKWEKMDHQYVRQKSHDSLDEGYRSREAVEADYRRQLSRETLLRSLSRSKAGSRDSLDRWVENGVRSRGMWRKLDEECHGPSVIKAGPDSFGPTQPGRFSPLTPTCKSNKQYLPPEKSYRPNNNGGNGSKSRKEPTTLPSPTNGSRIEPKRSFLGPKDKSYKELGEQERFPGLDRDTARSLHSSSQNLSQHIYSEPSFDSHRSTHSISKPKKFSFAFWK